MQLSTSCENMWKASSYVCFRYVTVWSHLIIFSLESFKRSQELHYPVVFVNIHTFSVLILHTYKPIPIYVKNRTVIKTHYLDCIIEIDTKPMYFIWYISVKKNVMLTWRAENLNGFVCEIVLVEICFHTI